MRVRPNTQLMKKLDANFVFRAIVVGFCCAFLFIGIDGVCVSRTVFSKHTTIHIPIIWYWISALPQVVIILSVCLLPKRFFGFSNKNCALIAILVFISVLLSATSPFLYVFYDYEGNSKRSEITSSVESSLNIAQTNFPTTGF
jgi:hypothetical protein